MRRYFTVAAALIAAAAIMASADAQERKKPSERQRNEQQERAPKPSLGGWPSCHSGMVILEDGGSAPLCRHRDGRICAMRDGGGDYVTLTDCK